MKAGGWGQTLDKQAVVRMEVPSCEREGPGLEHRKSPRGHAGDGAGAGCLRHARSGGGGHVLIRSLENSVCKHSSSHTAL